MMRLACLILIAACLSCSAPTSVLEGAWQSNRPLTLEDMRQRRSFTERQWEFLSDPTLFGHMIHIYRGNQGVVIYENECSPMAPLDIVKEEASSVTIRFYGDLPDEERTMTIIIENDRLYMPISILKGNLREVFTRRDMDEVVEKYPCIKDYL